MAARNPNFRFPWLGAIAFAVVLVGVGFGLSYIFVDELFLGDPILTLAPGTYDVVGYHQGEREFLFWLKTKDVEGPAQYHSIPADIVVVQETLLNDLDTLEVRRKGIWTRVDLHVRDP